MTILQILCRRKRNDFRECCDLVNFSINRKQTDRQANRQADRQANRQANTQADRQLRADKTSSIITGRLDCDAAIQCKSVHGEDEQSPV